MGVVGNKMIVHVNLKFNKEKLFKKQKFKAHSFTVYRSGRQAICRSICAPGTNGIKAGNG